jgi:hypothetical protein
MSADDTELVVSVMSRSHGVKTVEAEFQVCVVMSVEVAVVEAETMWKVEEGAVVPIPTRFDVVLA